MVRPNVSCSYLLQLPPIKDSLRGHSQPQETTFPDYERFSMHRDAFLAHFRLLVNPGHVAFSFAIAKVLKSGEAAPPQSGTREKFFQTLQGAKHTNQKRISKDPDGKQKSVSHATGLLLRSHAAIA
jgi:hypothetical protein